MSNAMEEHLQPRKQKSGGSEWRSERWSWRSYGGMMKGEKARDFKGTMAKLLEYLGAYKVGILIVMIFAIASTVFTIIGPKILGRATTRLFEGVMAMIAGTGRDRF